MVVEQLCRQSISTVVLSASNFAEIRCATNIPFTVAVVKRDSVSHSRRINEPNAVTGVREERDCIATLVLNFRCFRMHMPEISPMSFFRQRNHGFPLNGTHCALCELIPTLFNGIACVTLCVCVCVTRAYFNHYLQFSRMAKAFSIRTEPN